MKKHDFRFQILNTGISLLEILVVITVFAVLGIIIARSVFLTLGGSKKSDSQVKIRENVNYALSIIERQIRNANSIVTCPNSPTTTLEYLDENGVSASFSCVNVGGSDSYIASSSARLTSGDIQIVSCSLACIPGDGGVPQSVKINVTAQDAASATAESYVDFTTEIFLRTY